MPDYNNITEVLTLLTEAQNADADNRGRVREVTNFLEKDDGQWEDDVYKSMSGRPRYTFDKCNPVVDSIAGEMEQAEFGIKIRPAGGDATKETALIYNGMIRNIQAMSNAENMVYTPAVRQMVASGFACWRVTQEWADDNSFDQDLLIRVIGNSVDRVWFDPGAEMQDMSDANWAFVLQSVTAREYKERWPNGSGMSVGDSNPSEEYFHKAEQITVGEFLYKVPVNKELVRMSSGAIYEVDEKYERVKSELESQGVTEVKRRIRKVHKVMTRQFDGKDWLKPAEDTTFDYIPVIPVYANHKISGNKVIYRGAVNKLMDAQRVYNYAQSRAIEEGALAPRAKTYMTKDQGTGHEKQLQTLNTNADPVQFYNHVEGQVQPYSMGGAQINPGLSQTSVDMTNNIAESSSIFAANQGVGLAGQSGVAIDKLQNKGDNSTIKYFTSQEIAMCHTGRILLNAIPKVYDTKRIVRVLGEDGSVKMETINDEIFDEETQEMVSLNDLSKGIYDVTCDVGPAFKNRQQETQEFFFEAAKIDPSIIGMGKDVLLNNINAPGAELMAERARKQLFEGGMIPDSQMTDEEKEAAQKLIEQGQAEQAALAEQGPSPMEQAVLQQTETDTADTMSKIKEREDKNALSIEKQDFEEAKFAAGLNQEQAQMMMNNQKMIIDALNTQANTLKTLKESMGVDTVVSEGGAESYQNQTEIVQDSQEDVEKGAR